MLHGLIGRSTSVDTLKGGLDVSMRRTEAIAHRVANASTPGFDHFAAVLDGVAGGALGVDLEAEMVALADEQIRYDAMSRLLQRVYEQVRASVRGG
ncbi:MAG: hypothetical protein FWJ74_07080 [Gemmatimonadota bacterium]|jgi:flagellar basal body rod protein FlgB